MSEEKLMSQAQGPGPGDLQARIEREPGQAQGAENRRLAAFQPLRHNLQCTAQKAKGRARSIQAATPAAQGGRGGHAIGVFEQWGSIFPGTALHKAPPQRFAARHQTVLGVGQGESREEADRHAAVLALAASVADQVVTVVMRLLAPPAVASDGIGLTR